MRTTATSKVQAAKHTIIAAVALTLGVLAAVPATATTVISSGGVEGRYSHSEYSASADGKEFLVQVRGVPSAGIAQAAFDRALMNVLNATRPSQPATNFTARPTRGNPAFGMMFASLLPVVFPRDNPLLNSGS